VAKSSKIVCTTSLVNEDTAGGMHVHVLECDYANDDVTAPQNTVDVRHCMHKAAAAVPPRLQKVSMYDRCIAAPPPLRYCMYAAAALPQSTSAYQHRIRPPPFHRDECRHCTMTAFPRYWSGPAGYSVEPSSNRADVSGVAPRPPRRPYITKTTVAAD
jgi:hypothetical protein